MGVKAARRIVTQLSKSSPAGRNAEFGKWDHLAYLLAVVLGNAKCHDFL